MDKNKLKAIFDVAILRHGFTEYNRDYDFIIEMDAADNPGQYLLRFKHVYELNYLTRLKDETLKISTNESFTDYQTWEEAGKKDGFVWGVNYSLAYPGFKVIDNSDKADKWTRTLGIDMFNVILETETYKIDFVTTDFELIKLNNDKAVITRPFMKQK